MWRHRMMQHSLVTTELIMIFLHRGKTRKTRSNGVLTLKSTESSWWCCKLRGRIIVRIEAPRKQARRRDVIVIFKVARV